MNRFVFFTVLVVLAISSAHGKKFFMANDEKCDTCKNAFDQAREPIKAVCPDTESCFQAISSTCKRTGAPCPDDDHIHATCQYVCDAIANSGDFDSCIACRKPDHMNFCDC